MIGIAIVHRTIRQSSSNLIEAQRRFRGIFHGGAALFHFCQNGHAESTSDLSAAGTSCGRIGAQARLHERLQERFPERQHT